MFCTWRNIEVGVDTLSKARKNWTDCDRKDEPRTPIPASRVSVDAIGIVHVADIEFLFTDEVEIGNEYTGDGTHETCVTREESEELGALDND